MTSESSGSSKAWAHTSGKISMRPLEPSDWSPAALEARARIAETFNRYATGHDEARADVVISCYTQDVIFEVGGAMGMLGRTEGLADVSAEFTRNLSAMPDQRRHLLGNILIEELDVKKGTAKALAISIVTSAENGLDLRASVLYDAHLRREKDGCWRFNYFFIGLDHYAGKLPPTNLAPDSKASS